MPVIGVAKVTAPLLPRLKFPQFRVFNNLQLKHGDQNYFSTTFEEMYEVEYPFAQ